MNNQIVTLSDSDLRRTAPSIFTKTPARHRVTDQYTYIPTAQIVKDMDKLGWAPVKAQQINPRKKDLVGFQKHMIIFQNASIFFKGISKDDLQPQIIITNSHDGFNSFRFRMGLIRFACINDVVIYEEKFADMRIIHKNYQFEDVQRMIEEQVSRVNDIGDDIKTFKSIMLSPAQKLAFAKKAMEIKYPYPDQYPCPIPVSDFLNVRRQADQSDDLWTVFNVVQENIIRGGISGKSPKNHNTHTRAVTAIDTTLRINEKLWTLLIASAARYTK